MKRIQITSFAILLISAILVIASCKKKDDDTVITPVVPVNTVCTPDTVFNPGTASGPRLVFKFKFDSTQTRLDNFGNPSSIPAGNAAQSPKFKFMSQHYIELANDTDPLGNGQVLYVGQQTSTGGAAAIDYCASTLTKDTVVFFSKPLSQITPGTYKWLRVSLAYQSYEITYKSNLLPSANHLGTGTLASFIGFKTYITGYKINGHDHTPSSTSGGQGNHVQGYWGFETNVLGVNYFIDGQAPAGATTVPNPLFASSPIPAGSCVVTGKFVDNALTVSPLVITGTETTDIIITVSLSTNKSFEWHEVNADGYYEPNASEYVVDMGIRGLIPIKN